MARAGPTTPLAAAAYASATGKDLGWILLAWAIFNTYMLIVSSQANLAVFLVFLTLEATEVILFIGVLRQQLGRAQVRRLHRDPDRDCRLVHVRGRGAQRDEGQGHRARGQPLFDL